jgi:hypothetical protein
MATITTKLIADNLRSGKAVSADVPVNASFTDGIVILRADIESAAYVDKSNWLRIATYADGVFAGAMVWTGGPYTDEDGNVNPMPTLSFPVSKFRGKAVRVELDVAKQQTVGLTLTTANRKAA